LTKTDENENAQEGVSERRRFKSFSYASALLGLGSADDNSKENDQERMMDDNNGASESSDMIVVRPSDALIQQYAEEVLHVFNDGFNWSDLAEMIRMSNDRLRQDFPQFTLEERKEQVIAVLSKVVDMTDTPYLPDQLTDPLLKKMIPPFVDLLLPAFDGEDDLTGGLEQAEGKPSEEEIRSFAENVQAAFDNSFSWNDFASVVRLARNFARSYEGLNAEERQETAISVINQIIDSTDTPYLPDDYIDPVFKSFVEPIVKALL
jgi:hypothetical protein